jgi:hypothetical protein
MAEAEPTVRLETVPNELKPVPVITTVSSTEAELGVIVICGAGIANAVELPVIDPTVATTMAVPGESEPPVVAAGISVVTTNPPTASVRYPPEGIPLAPPKVRTDPVVLGGKLLPVTVTELPVEAAAGETVIVPVGIFKLAEAVLLVVDSNAIVDSFNASALSVATMVTVEAAVPVGMVTTPVPDPSEPTGNVVVPVKVRPLTVKVAVVVFSALSTVIPVTVTVMDCPGPASAGVRVKVRAVRLNPLEEPETVPSFAVMVTDALGPTAKPSRVGILVA